MATSLSETNTVNAQRIRDGVEKCQLVNQLIVECYKLLIRPEKVFETHTRVGGVVRFKCKEKGYEISGSEIRTCQNDESWSGFPTSCKIISCGNPGFTMQGSSILTCTRTGAWDKVKPSCTCEKTNKEAFRYCRKQCNPDLGCSRDRQCVCDGDCGYSCVSKVADCGKPFVLQNGRDEYSSTTFLSTFRYRCNKPYTLLGSKIRTCRGIRRWDGTEPSCKIICKDPGDINNGSKQIFSRNYDEDYVAVGDRAEYTYFPGLQDGGLQIPYLH
ncbi:hypothetical protein ACROYT_G017878 [Oculina patagonica]